MYEMFVLALLKQPAQCMTHTIIIGYYPPTREVSYLLRETRGREAPEGESSKYDTSRGRRVVTQFYRQINAPKFTERIAASF